MPNGGIQFTQREIGWSAPFPFSEGVDILVDRVWTLRTQNPVLVRLRLPTDREIIRQEILVYNHAVNPDAFVSDDPPSPTKSTRTATTHAEKRVGCCGKRK